MLISWSRSCTIVKQDVTSGVNMVTSTQDLSVLPVNLQRTTKNPGTLDNRCIVSIKTSLIIPKLFHIENRIK